MGSGVPGFPSLTDAAVSSVSTEQLPSHWRMVTAVTVSKPVAQRAPNQRTTGLPLLPLVHSPYRERRTSIKMIRMPGFRHKIRTTPIPVFVLPSLSLSKAKSDLSDGSCFYRRHVGFSFTCSAVNTWNVGHRTRVTPRLQSVARPARPRWSLCCRDRWPRSVTGGYGYRHRKSNHGQVTQVPPMLLRNRSRRFGPTEWRRR